LNVPSLDAVSWKAVNLADIKWRSWGNEHVVFHRPSGKLHLLNDSSLRLLREVLTEPLGTKELITLLAGPEPTPAEIDQVVGLLMYFDELGLVTSE